VSRVPGSGHADRRARLSAPAGRFVRLSAPDGRFVRLSAPADRRARLRAPAGRFVRLLAPLVGLGLLLGGLFAPGIALAHDVLVGSDPVDGAKLDTGPSRIQLRFDLPVQDGFNTVTLIGPDGAHYEEGTAQVDGSTVSVAAGPLGPAGLYRVGYRVVSDDGHPVSGSISFTLTRAGTGSGHPGPAGSTPTAAADDAGQGSSMPVWPWIVGAVVLVIAGAAVALRAGRD
jgi:methionine-rich copper-binding protein CopC